MVVSSADLNRALLRYLDTGSRDPSQALGAWLAAMTDDESVTAVRFQSGFFGAEALGYFVEVLKRIAAAGGPVSLLVGSNDGTTKRRDLELLLELAGPPREGRRLGVVAFDNAYFHPKTFHFERSDGSAAAYVGSANLTRSGATSLHVEAGVVLDTNDGDDPAVLATVRNAIDWWFESTPDGFTLVTDLADLDDLVARGRLDVPRPPLVRPVTPVLTSGSTDRITLSPLAAIPTIPTTGSTAPPTTEPPADSAEASAEQPGTVTPPRSGPPAVTTVEWSKVLSQSDAQRKPQGNQRGSITLVAAGYPINAQTYFRYDFFRGVAWTADTTSTGEGRETAAVAFATTVLGQDLGTLQLPVSYAPNREASQANYTALLHVGSLGPQFAAHDMTGRTLRLERRSDGSFALAIE
jgi:hypothetical protein